MLTCIKIVHTFIWALMGSATLYILYAGITNSFNTLLTLSLILLSIETLVLLFNKWTCPLSPLARKYTNEQVDNFDIYLPAWFAKYNKQIFGTLFVIGTVFVLYNWTQLP